MKKSSPHSAPPITTVRLPADLLAEIKYAAGINGNTLNAEIIRRLAESVVNPLHKVIEQNEKTHELLEGIIAKMEIRQSDRIR